MFLIREYFNEDKTEILSSNGWVEVMEVPQKDRHESMGCVEDAEYWTVYRCRDLNGEWNWDCSPETAERLDREVRPQGRAESKNGPYIVRYVVSGDAEENNLQDHLNRYAREGYQLVQLEKLNNSPSPQYQLVLVEPGT
jgi:hypothetical protein